MENMFSIIHDPGLRGVLNNLSVVSLFLAIAVSIVALVFYGRAREVDGASAQDQRWVMLFGTWRDSLTITLLYTAQGFVYRFSDFKGLVDLQAESLFFFSPIVVPVLLLVSDVLIFVVAIMRVIVLSRWLSQVTR